MAGRRVAAGDVGIGVADHPDLADLAGIHEALGHPDAAPPAGHGVDAEEHAGLAGRRAIIASISGSVAAIGFSVKTCLPAAAAAIAWSRWSGVGVPSSTMSTSGRASSASSEGSTAIPKRDAELLGAPSAMDGDQARIGHELRVIP